MNEIHEANRANWNDYAEEYKERSDKQGVWDKCHLDPTLALFPSEIEALGDVNGKKICVLGSGNNCEVFALAGMGADVTSVDISEAQLRIAEERAEILGLTISFVRADVTDLDVLLRRAGSAGGSPPGRRVSSTSSAKLRAHQPLTGARAARSSGFSGLAQATSSSVTFGQNTPGSISSSFARRARQCFSPSRRASARRSRRRRGVAEGFFSGGSCSGPSRPRATASSICCPRRRTTRSVIPLRPASARFERGGFRASSSNVPLPSTLNGGRSSSRARVAQQEQLAQHGERAR